MERKRESIHSLSFPELGSVIISIKMELLPHNFFLMLFHNQATSLNSFEVKKKGLEESITNLFLCVYKNGARRDI